MATVIGKKPCAKCNKGEGGGVTTCNGCRQIFCTKHFVEHRLELSHQMDTISQDHDILRDELAKDSSTHSILTRIDNWEQESISRIQAAAENARIELRQYVDRTKNDLKCSVEKMTTELQLSQKSDDFTENDLKRWTEQLKELRKKLDTPAILSINNEDEVKSSITLIQIHEKQRPSTPTIRTSDHRSYCLKESNHTMTDRQQRSSTPISRTCDQRHLTNRDHIPTLADKQQRPSTPTLRPLNHRLSNSTTMEKFEEIDGKAVLSEDNLVVTCCLASILTQPIVYGANRYSTGKHQIRFRIEKMGDQRLFFGIIRSLENISRSGQAQNNNNFSLYGWWDLNETIVNGKTQTSKYRSIVTTGDELTLILDCENKQIQLQHHRTKRLAQCSLDLDKCPFPWKIVIRLQSAGDCIRILR
ncbi:unnamed protein product [Adineta ricciae]|uniref:B box-type domain-containing protein n=1 Tax=Adineta ricciae TaxID=249248 RepID=A0A815CKP6_ADIRI|nr:unnamed protein product [Adineta ricciae]